MREFTIGDYLVQIDSEGYVQKVIEDGKEKIKTLSDQEISDLKGLAKQQAEEEYGEHWAESRFEDECYHGC